MNVVMFSPGYPPEMPFFTRGLGQVGARVIGVGDTPEGSLPPMTRRHLAAYIQVDSWSDEEAVIQRIRQLDGRGHVDRIECLWEPLMILAARLREMLGLPGMTVAETVPFRDKERMKQALDRVGLRTPRHARANSVAQVAESMEQVGFPAILKPIAGAGSADTYRVEDRRALDAVLPLLRHVQEVSVEEFVEGQDYTFDTICVDGKIVFYNIAFYRPRALVSRNHRWVSPQTVAVREVDAPDLEPGRWLGGAVLKTLGFRTGFTHMEWYRTDDGEAVFGEIAARPPGARTVDVMNWASDLDLFTGWAEAVCHGRFSQRISRGYNAVGIFKRAQGDGRIQRVEGLDRLLAELAPWITAVELTPVGQPNRNWLQSIIGDGFVMLRHPELETALHMADRVGTELQLYAG